MITKKSLFLFQASWCLEVCTCHMFIPVEFLSRTLYEQFETYEFTSAPSLKMERLNIFNKKNGMFLYHHRNTIQDVSDRVNELCIGNSNARRIGTVISANLPRSALQQHQSPPDLLFVNNFNLNEVTIETRRAVRSHVMRNYRSQTRRRKIIELKPNLPSNPRLHRVLGAGRVDPFDSFPISMTSSMSRLFDRCKFRLFKFCLSYR